MDNAIAEAQRQNNWERLAGLAERAGDDNIARLARARALSHRLGTIKVTNLEVDYHDRYANSPSISMELNREPNPAEFVYEQKGPMYFAQLGPIANFYAYTAPGRGYGGTRQNLTMRDGSVKGLIGPFSGNSGEINCRFDTQVKECSYKSHKYDISIASVITIEALLPLLKEKGLGLAKANMGGTVFYEILSRKKYPDTEHGQKPTSWEIESVVLEPTDG